MHTDQVAPITATWRPLEIFSGLWRRVGKSVRETMDAARSEQVMSNPPAYLGYDTGELDYRPPHPASLDEVLRDRRTSLEWMWLRHGL